MGILQKAGEERAGRMMVCTTCVGPELAGIGFGAVTGQGIDGKEDQGRDAAGGEDAQFGQQVAREWQADEQIPGTEGGASCQQHADELRDREAKDRPQRIVKMARRLMVTKHARGPFVAGLDAGGGRIQ
jgi:hypothetical protein